MDKKQTNLFAFEGINGCGKSTQIDMLFNKLSKDIKIKVFNEPSESILGKTIRHEYLTGKSEADTFLMANLFMVDRYSQIINEVVDATNDGYNILQSRSFVSSMVLEYAKSGDPEDYKRIFELNKECINRYYENNIKLHIIFIDVNPDTCIDRQKKMNNIADIHECEDFMRKQRKAFLDVLLYLQETQLKMIDEDLFEFHIVNGNRSKEEVFNDIGNYIIFSQMNSDIVNDPNLQD